MGSFSTQALSLSLSGPPDPFADFTHILGPASCRRPGFDSFLNRLERDHPVCSPLPVAFSTSFSSFYHSHIPRSRHQRAKLSSSIPYSTPCLLQQPPTLPLPSHPSSNSRPTAPGRILQRSILHPPRPVTTPPPPCHSSQRSASLGHPRPPHPIQLSRAIIHLTHTLAPPPISPYLHRAINHAKKKKHRASPASAWLTGSHTPVIPYIRASTIHHASKQGGVRSVRRWPQMSRR
ncbi:hypothetical protein BDP55DRAFT_288577 [Colletotrichum godetiae]|uniref:Uncharacterized protein n=1 Tax=Colletotrichum godetiae TaxID=1209918 RepID=A0AAJ0AE87_9PEZI|nr:uncharacterized protein BDP55DRAFT_288577 [Colletotrichum godetiae]KAK1671624.1 hypothetical protein BDP55DRAFT_288577 [Colletotrichum godetiae]